MTSIIAKAEEENRENLYGFLLGLKNKQQYNFHLVTLSRNDWGNGVSERGKSEEARGKIVVKLLGIDKKIIVQRKNLKIFSYVNFFDVPRQNSPVVSSCTVSVPGTIPLKAISLIVEKYLRLPEGIGRYISAFLEVEKLDHREVKAVGCSSSSNQHILSEALTENTSTWWISDAACPEWVEFEVSSTRVMQQIGIISDLVSDYFGLH